MSECDYCDEEHEQHIRLVEERTVHVEQLNSENHVEHYDTLVPESAPESRYTYYCSVECLIAGLLADKRLAEFRLSAYTGDEDE